MIEHILIGIFYLLGGFGFWFGTGLITYGMDYHYSQYMARRVSPKFERMKEKENFYFALDWIWYGPVGLFIYLLTCVLEIFSGHDDVKFNIRLRRYIYDENDNRIN